MSSKATSSFRAPSSPKSVFLLNSAFVSGFFHGLLMKGCWKFPRTEQEKALTCLSLFLLVVIFAFIIALCLVATRNTVSSSINVHEDSTICDTQACKDTARMIQDAMDPNADPCEDFFQYACGEWIEKHPIPDDMVQYSTFDVLSDEVDKNISGLFLRWNSSSNAPGPIKSAITFFRGCVNEDSRQKRGLEPLKNLLRNYQGWPMMEPKWDDSKYQWYIAVAKIIRDCKLGVIISVSVEPYESRNMIHISDAPLSLGRNQLISLNSSKRNEELIRAYKEYIKSSARLLNPRADEMQLTTDANKIVEFESSIAKLTQSPEEKRIISKSYNKMSVGEMQVATLNRVFSWKDFLNVLFEGYISITDETEVVIDDIRYLKEVLDLMHHSEKRTIANFIGSQVSLIFGPQTIKKFREKKFELDKVVGGIQKMPSLQSTCLLLIKGLMDYPVSRLYVDRYFSEEAKTHVESMVQGIRSAYHAAFKNSAWLDDTTKSQAVEKLEAMISMMAYPQWIKKDEELEKYYESVGNLKEEEYFHALLTMSKFMIGKYLEKINMPKDRTSEWLPAASVNAFYSPTANIITFPAGILNAPFYDYDRAISLNFGAIGSIIGHEVGHGFDDEGCQYDKYGNIAKWWSEEVELKFKERAQCFRDQYSSYVEPKTRMQLNGNNTVGENMADNTGLKSSYIAYKLMLMLSENEKILQNKRLPGFFANPDQLYFIGFAQAWCGSKRKESMEFTIQYDVHSPHKYRVNVPLSNFNAFAEAFHCPLGSPMNPEAKCNLW